MPRTRAALVLLAATALAACTPTFNWREVHPGSTSLTAMLPCKPDHSERDVPMAGRQVSLEVWGCEAGGATFAILFADIGDGGRAGEALRQWKTATLANLRSASAQETRFRPPGAVDLAQSLQVVATGQRADGSPVESQAAYFARGTYVFQAVIYSERVQPQAADMFFAGLKFE